MKRIVIVSALIISLAVAGSAFAYGQGYGGGGCGQCPGFSQNDTSSKADIEAMKKFDEETATLRKALNADQVELMALMEADNPDPKAARALAEKIYEGQDKISAIAEKYGVPCRVGRGMGMGMGRGHGRGHGKQGANCPRFGNN